MYQALYRKWRPKTFDDVVGQKHITDTLKNQVLTGRLSHAYLFIGTRGTGKTTCAKILAKAVNCEAPVNGNPCNQCRACRGIDDGSVLDVVEIDAASNNGVDNVRALRDEAVFSPAMVKKRVYIVDEVHMLSLSAFNALLKILEEPPEHLMFILATTELHKVPATILSRCQRHSFKRLDTEAIVGRLRYVAKQEQLNLTDEAATLIARLAEGGMRDALSLLDQCAGRGEISAETVYSAMGLAGRQETLRLTGYIAAGRAQDALSLFQQLWQDGKDPETLLGEISSLLRDVLMRTVAPKGGADLLSSGFSDEALDALRKQMSRGQLINSISEIQDTLGSMRNGHAKTLCELCIIRLSDPTLGESLPQLRERIARLEQMIAGGAAVPAPQPRREEPAVQEHGTPDPPPFDPGEPPPAPEEIPFDLGEPVKEAAPPATIPETPSFAPPEPAPLPAGEDDSWSRILRAADGSIPPGIYAILTDPLTSEGRVSGKAVTVSVEPGFALNTVNRPDVIARLSSAAATVLGEGAHVTVQEKGVRTASPSPAANTAADSKLEELKKFEIVSFK